MAEVKVTIDCVIVSPDGSTILGPCSIVGSMRKTGLAVGGGPVFPEDPDRPHVPDMGAHPEHPIYFPPPPPGYPNPPADGLAKDPPPGGGWGYSLEFGWGFFPMGGPIPGPK